MDISLDGVPHKALGILPALCHRWSTTRLLHKKDIRTPYCTTLLYRGCPIFFFDTTQKIIQLRPSRQGGGSDTVPSLKRHTKFYAKPNTVECSPSPAVINKTEHRER